MNYKISTYALLTGLAVAFSGCQDEMMPKENHDGNIKIVALTDNDLLTRTCVDSENPTKTGILWSPGDLIGVYGSNGTRNAVFRTPIVSNAAEAEFSGTLAGNEYPQYAYYPYSVDNNSSDKTALKGNLKLEQTFDMTTGKLESDYKVGEPTMMNQGTEWKFKFEHLFSLLRFNINATGTALQGDKLEKIILTLPEERRLGGEFSFDLTNKNVIWTGTESKANEIVMNWSDTPALTNGAEYTGYITCAPNIKVGDEIKITIVTTLHKAEFTRTSLANFEANACYTFPLTLENYNNDMTVTDRPVFTSFSFEVKNNTGKILDKKLVFNGGATTPVDNAAEVLTVDGEMITGCIPYSI